MLLIQQFQVGQTVYCYSWNPKRRIIDKKEVRIVWIYNNDTAEVKHLDSTKVELVNLQKLRPILN